MLRNELQVAVATLKGDATTRGDEKVWAHVHNYEFDERLGGQREEAVVPFLPANPQPLDLAEAHAAYVKNRVRVEIGNVPDTFLALNEPAHRADLDNEEWIVRGEDVGWRLKWAQEQGLASSLDGAFTWLQARMSEAAAGDISAKALLANWIEAWNTARDARPMFACAEQDVASELSSADWADALRISLGLEHWRPEGTTPVYIALMRYKARDIGRAVQNRTDVSNAYAIPTVLDQAQWPWFFPAPQDPNIAANDSYGRALRLEPNGDWKLLRSEFLHFHFDYHPEHLTRLARITTAPPGHPLKRLRNAHLDAVRLASGRANFGEYVP